MELLTPANIVLMKGELRADDDLDLALEVVNKMCSQIVKEGHQIFEGSMTPIQLSGLIEEVKKLPPHSEVVEVGLNVGISAAVMLTVNPTLNLLSFDLGEWSCARRAAELLHDLFPGRFRVTWGDSKQTLPFLRNTYDLVVIDGGHDYMTAYADIHVLAKIAKTLFIDDVNMEEVRRAVNHAIFMNEITLLHEYFETAGWVPRSWGVYKGQA